MFRVVLDTNILVAALLYPLGKPAKTLAFCISKKAEICYNSQIMWEYEDVLFRPRFKFDIEEIKNTLLTEFKKVGLIIEPTPSTIYMPHESDRIFYDTAKVGDAMLITGNRKHYPDEPFILSPAEFLEKFDQGD